MPVDPDDLLIFKKRGITEKELPSPNGEKLLAAPKQEQKPAPARQPQQPLPTAPVAQAEQQAQVQMAIATAATTESIPPVQSNEGNPPPEKLDVNKVARENVSAAKGKVCINHPWRGAYSLCNYCKRPFCYADLITFEKNFYCLEDIDHISKGNADVRYSRNMITMVAGLVMLVDAGLLILFTYPSILVFLHAAQSNIAAANIPAVQASTFASSAILFIGAIATTVYSYIFQSLYTLVAVLSVVGGLAIVTSSRKGFYFGIIVALITLFSFTYAYLETNLAYTILIAAVAFVDIAVLGFSRMSAITFTPDIDTSRKYIDWPKPESF